MIVYQAEKDVGLSDILLDPSKSCISFASEAEPLNDGELNKLTISLAALKNLSNIAKAQISDKDLYPLKTILVTTSWNKNDDVFSNEEVWAARHTPEDKPFNLGHAELDIIGHITDNRCIDDKYKVISDDLSVDLLPAKFHVLTAAVIYRAIADQDRKEMIEKIIAEIPQGKWFVSMECYFQGFDYAVKAASDEPLKVIARCKESAFLTQHLRAYGGKGEYDGYKVGRLMRNICFSGKGLVEKPANVESIILTDKLSKELSFASQIYNTITELKPDSKTGELEMADTTADKKNEEKIEKLEAALEKVKETAKSELDAAKAESKTLTDKVAELEKSNKTLADEKAASDKKLVDAEKELNDTKVAAKLVARISALVEVGVEKADAEAKAKKFESVNDEMFTEIVEMAKSALTVAKSDDDDDMNADEEDKKATDKAKKSKDQAAKMKKAKAAEKAEAEAAADDVETEDIEAEDLEDLDLNGEAELDEESEKVVAHVNDYFADAFGNKNKKDSE